MSTNRLPPHHKDAERGILGGVLRNPEILGDIQETICTDSFYFDAHRRLFAALESLTAERAQIDLVSVIERLRQRKDLEDVGGPEFIAELWEETPTGANCSYYASLVRDAAINRRMIHIANEMIRDAHDRPQPADELLAKAERMLFELAIGSAKGTDLRSAREFLFSALTAIDTRIASGGALAGLSTGLIDLDEILGGLRPGQLVVIGARPSVGKTALAVTIGARVALAGTPALLFSMEMPEAEIANRLLSMGSGVPMSRFTRAVRLESEEIQRLAAAASPAGFGDCPIWLDDSSSPTAARIATVTRKAVRRHRVGLVLVDYLQLMQPENLSENRALQVGTMARRMKQLARDCNVPLILLSQLNRECENRGDGKPKLSDLRESGDIEAHADVVILLHRPTDQRSEASGQLIDALIRKNRNGPTGDVTLCFLLSVMRFENAIRD
jgi:replicative DNA helicase